MSSMGFYVVQGKKNSQEMFRVVCNLQKSYVLSGTPLTILQIMKVFTIWETQIHEQRWRNDHMCVIHNFFLNTGAGEQENFIEISYSHVKFLTTQ